MSVCKEKWLRGWFRALGTCLVFVALSACGGGNDESASADSGKPDGEETASPASPVVPAPSTNSSLGLEQPGNVSYLVTHADGSTRTMTATVAFTSPKGTLTLEAGTASAFDVVTEDDWANVTWPLGKSGVLRADGNAGLVCANEGSGVGVSHNMTRVSNPLDVIKGKTFEAFECTGGGAFQVENFAFNQDGSADVDGERVPAELVAAAFSDSGFSDPDGSSGKIRLYAWTANGQTTYHFVETGRDALDGGRFDTYVILGSQVVAK